MRIIPIHVERIDFSGFSSRSPPPHCRGHFQSEISSSLAPGRLNPHRWPTLIVTKSPVGKIGSNWQSLMYWKSWKIMENHGKSWKIMEHHRKPWKIIENHGKIMEHHWYYPPVSWKIMEHPTDDPEWKKARDLPLLNPVGYDFRGWAPSMHLLKDLDPECRVPNLRHRFWQWNMANRPVIC